MSNGRHCSLLLLLLVGFFVLNFSNQRSESLDFQSGNYSSLCILVDGKGLFFFFFN